MNKQYYNIITTGLIYNEPTKIIVESKQELDRYVKREFDYLRKWLIPDPNEFNMDDIKKIYKRTKKSYIYRDTEESLKNHAQGKKSGYAYTIQALSKDNEIIDVACYWCSKINKSDLWQFAGFKEIE